MFSLFDRDAGEHNINFQFSLRHSQSQSSFWRFQNNTTGWHDEPGLGSLFSAPFSLAASYVIVDSVFCFCILFLAETKRATSMKRAALTISPALSFLGLALLRWALVLGAPAFDGVGSWGKRTMPMLQMDKERPNITRAEAEICQCFSHIGQNVHISHRFSNKK